MILEWVKARVIYMLKTIVALEIQSGKVLINVLFFNSAKIIMSLLKNMKEEIEVAIGDFEYPDKDTSFSILVMVDTGEQSDIEVKYDAYEDLHNIPNENRIPDSPSENSIQYEEFPSTSDLHYGKALKPCINREGNLNEVDYVLENHSKNDSVEDLEESIVREDSPFEGEDYAVTIFINEKSIPCAETSTTKDSLSSQMKTYSEKSKIGYGSFKCFLCSSKFREKYDLKIHMRDHAGKNGYVCPICHKEYSLNYIRLHIKRHDKSCGKESGTMGFLKDNVKSHSTEGTVNSHSPEQPYTCKICSKGFSSVKEFGLHMATHGKKHKQKIMCKICGKEYSSQSTFIQHMYSHNHDKTFVCAVCDEEFQTSHDLTQHMKTHSDVRFGCPVCAKTFRVKQCLLQHLRIHTGERPYACSYCQKRFLLKRTLINHQLIHTGEKSFSCEVCNRKFSQKKYLVCHMRTHTGEKPFHCAECDKSFTQKSTLLHHMEIHNIDKPFECDQCDRNFAYKMNLVRHVSNNHNAGEKYVTCSVCKHCIGKKSLAQHMRTHSAEQPFQCSICDMRFNKKSNYNRHLLLHDKKNEFSCSKCERSFSQKAYLARHMKTHDVGDLLFTCDECGRTFPRKGSFVLHLKTHSDKKFYTCSVCEEGFSGRTYLARHLKAHAAGNLFICTECKMNFSEKSDLIDHIRKNMCKASNEKVSLQEENSDLEKERKETRKLIKHQNKVNRKPQHRKQLTRRKSLEGELCLKESDGKKVKYKFGVYRQTCNTCDKIFISPSTYARHMKNHE